MSSSKYVEIARKIREWAIRPELTERQRALAEAAAELALSVNDKAAEAGCSDDHADDEHGGDLHDLRVYGCYLCKYVGATGCLCPSESGQCTVSWSDFHGVGNESGASGCETK